MVALFQVDSFTTKPFAGNPAGVCVLSEPTSDEWMQRVAAEMNLSETAFLMGSGNSYTLRWFTPRTEVSLCGHATLASAHILFEESIADPASPVFFETKSGELVVAQRGGLIEMDFPTREAVAVAPNEALNDAIGVSPESTAAYRSARGDLYLLELGSADEVRNATPDYDSLMSTDVTATIITAPSDEPSYHFVSRFFAPAVGIDEDPVTGSAHCTLAPHWTTKLGQSELVGYQASNRSGVVYCEWREERTLLRGDAVTVFKADLRA